MGNRIQRAYGIGAPYINVFPIPVSAERAPVSGQDVDYPQGQVWFDNSVSPVVEYVFDGHGNWVTGTPGSISSVAGTANQITASTSAGAVTLSIPTTFIAPGSIASTTTLTGGTGITATTGNISASAGNVSASGTVTGGTGVTATTGNVTATAGNFVASQAGNGFVLNSGTASGTTTATLNGRSGQVTVTTPSIAAGATFSFALTNSSITGSSTQVLYGLTGGTTGSAITIQSVTNSASTSTVVFQNASAVTNNTGSLVLTFIVIN